MFLESLFILIAGHSLADTALQPDAMSKGKRRSNPIDMSKVPKGQKPMRLWWMWLTHHALIHGLVVAILTGVIYLGVLEFVSHLVIDFFKSEGYFCPRVDQGLHLLMKLIWCIFI